MTVQPARAAASHIENRSLKAWRKAPSRPTSCGCSSSASSGSEEEKKGIADDVRDVYAEAKANGYDTKIMRMIVRLRKMETHTRQEQDALLETYRQALGLA